MQHLLRYKIVFSILGLIMICPLLSKSQLRDALNLPEHDDKNIHFGINLGFKPISFQFYTPPAFFAKR